MDVIDGGVVGVVGVEILGAVLGGAEVDHALISTNQERAVIIWLERDCSSTI